MADEPWNMPWREEEAKPPPWEMPWADPTPAAKPPERVDQPFTWGGAAKQAGVGAAKGVIGMFGAGGDFADFIGRKTEEYAPGYGQTGRRIAGAIASPGTALFSMGQAPPPPSSADIQKKVEGVTGEFRKPQNTAEDYAQSIGEFAPNVAMPVRGGVSLASNLVRRGANVVAPGVLSEGAGSFFKGTDVEPWARAAGAMAAPFGAAAAGRFITPNPINAGRQALVDTLRQEGLHPTAGQVTGNKALHNVESQAAEMPFSGGRASTTLPTQREDLARAAARSAGENIPPGQGVGRPEIDQMFGRLGNRFETLGRRNAMDLDNALAADLATTYRGYLDVTAPGMRVPIIDRIVQDIHHRATSAPGSPLSGEAYNRYTSQLAEAARNASDSGAQRAIYRIRHALDDAMERSMARNGSPDAGAFREVRGQYRNALAVEKAMLAASSDLGLGQMSAAALRNATRTIGGSRNFSRGRGDLNDLAVAADSIMKPLPQSGTAGRSMLQNAMNVGGAGLGAGAGGGIAGIPGAVAGMAAGYALPAMVGRTIMSRPGQAYLGNQILGGEARPSATRRALVNALISGQKSKRDEDERERERITVRPKYNVK